MSKTNQQFKSLPGVDTLLSEKAIILLIKRHSRELVVYAIRKVLAEIRESLCKNEKSTSKGQIIAKVKDHITNISGQTLKPVINATGVAIHTNLGRAPLGGNVLKDLTPLIEGYSNLEFNLTNGLRGQRTELIAPIINYLTDGEDTAVVNNNAAALMLILNTFAKRKEVIISRGELIEIGGSFRIPDILKTADVKMVEVGTTNRTRLSDYEKAITPRTALILKAHQSNYTIKGFTQESSVKELAIFSKKKNLRFVYDIGSGLLRKPKGLPLDNEPDVKTALKEGADLVTFSGDKLLGGPQAGIIVGKKDLIAKLNKAPMMRAMRVGKLTLATLLSVCRHYLDAKTLRQCNPTFSMLERTQTDLKKTAQKIAGELIKNGVDATIENSIAQCGGGTLPELQIKSFCIALRFKDAKKNQKTTPAEKIFHRLLELDKPIVGILRKGALVFDVLTIQKQDIPYFVSSVATVVSKKGRK